MKNVVFLLLLGLSACVSPSETGVEPQIKPVSADDLAAANPVPPKNDTLLYISDRTDRPIVSYALESDSFYNALLTRYIRMNKYGHDKDSVLPRDLLTKLVSRRSFVDMIVLFYSNDEYKHISYNPDERYRLEDIGRDMLLSFGNCCPDQTYVIADELLQKKSLEALELLWNIKKIDPTKLPSLSRVDPYDFYLNAGLAIFFHNKGMQELSKFYLQQASNNPPEPQELKDVQALFKRKGFVDYSDFTLAVFNEG